MREIGVRMRDREDGRGQEETAGKMKLIYAKGMSEEENKERMGG